jgi:hypothetical protein
MPDVGRESGPRDERFDVIEAGVVCAEENSDKDRWWSGWKICALDDVREVGEEAGGCVAGGVRWGLWKEVERGNTLRNLCAVRTRCKMPDS